MEIITIIASIVSTIAGLIYVIYHFLDKRKHTKK